MKTLAIVVNHIENTNTLISVFGEGTSNTHTSLYLTNTRRHSMIKKTLLVLTIAALALTSTRAGILDDWGQPALVKEFFIEYRIKFHQEGTHITSITLDRKGKASGNAYFHGGECYALMLTVARGPGRRVNFDKDVTTTTENIWVDTVTGNRLKGDENEQIWRFEVDDKTGTPILTGELENGSDFAITEVN